MNFKKRVNGSWHDIPHYIHKTDTDTITTLPAVLYPTGTTATVGLKGQTLQSSIPSPTSPIMPQGTGDLETVGAKAGQYKIPILSNSITTNVYLGEVQTTRKIRKLVLTGEEQGWSLYRTGAVLAISSMKNNMRGIGRCSHFTPTYSPSTETRDAVCFGASNNLLYLLFSDSTASALNITNLDSIKQWLQDEYAAGTPVTIWYVLAEPETAVVNEPLMKIGNYADEVSNVSIPVTAGTNTLSVGTTVQPSEVIATYKGWHPITNTHIMEGLLADNPLCGINTYKDELNLASGECTRNIKKKVFNGSENWTLYNGNFFSSVTDSNSKESRAVICSHIVSPDGIIVGSGSVRLKVIKSKLPSFIATTDDFKDWITEQYNNDTPFTVWYILETPTTETITVPSGLSGTEEGYLNQSGTPTPTNPIYPTANEVKVWK